MFICISCIPLGFVGSLLISEVNVKRFQGGEKLAKTFEERPRSQPFQHVTRHLYFWHLECSPSLGKSGKRHLVILDDTAIKASDQPHITRLPMEATRPSPKTVGFSVSSLPSTSTVTASATAIRPKLFTAGPNRQPKGDFGAERPEKTRGKYFYSYSSAHRV